MKNPTYVTTNDKLRALMVASKLSRDDVAEHLGKSRATVDAWLKPATSRSHRRMPANDLQLLEIRISRLQPA